MKVLGCSVLLILWACCGAEEEGSKCGFLPLLPNGDIVGIPQPSYPSGTTVEYKCQSYHKILGNSKVTCLNGVWSALPECLEPCTARPEEMAENNLRFRWIDNEKVYTEHGQYIEFMCISTDYSQHKESPPFRIKCNRGILLYPKCIKQEEGSKCGPLPLLPNGDIVGIPQPSYPSGTTVEYKCQSYHKISGNNKVTCLNGAWSALPECLEPCTASPEEMAKNNLGFRWMDNVKLYTVHGEYIEFMCLSRDYIQHKESPPFRIKCNRGILLYPKCIKQGSCTPSSKEMDPKNIILMNKNTEIKDGTVAEFACKPGFYKKPNEIMTVKCIRGNLEYPECDRAPFCSKPPLLPHGKIVGDVENEYNLDSSVEYICDEDYALEGTRMLICNGGRWSGDMPQCIQPCHLTKDEIDKNFLELYPPGDISQAVKHKTSIPFKCKEGYFKEPHSQLFGQCKHGTITYPSCIIDSPCPVSKDKLEEHFVELSSTHRDKTAFKEGDTIIFRCKSGFRGLTPPGSLVANCTKNGFTYPTCINPNPCRVSQEGIDLHNLELVGDKIIFHQEDTIQFRCKPGYFAPLTGTCKNSNIKYPTCLPKGSCLLKHEEIEQNNNIKLLPAFANLPYATNDQTIEFTCKEGYIKHTSSSDMSQVCEDGIIAYPTCIKPRTRG